jgi:hypothetical protein
MYQNLVSSTGMKANIAGIVVGCVLVLIVLFVGHIYTKSQVDAALQNTHLALDTMIAEQEVILVTIADLVKQSAADAITERIIVDCSGSERQQFDALLNKLSVTISPSELRELDTLFLKCGRFYADRKSVMAARLIREVAVYKAHITLKQQTGVLDEIALSRVVRWQQIAETELEIAKNFTTLVDLQGDIILTLLAGKDRTSPEITATLDTVKETRDAMTVQTKQIEKLREELRTI